MGFVESKALLLTAISPSLPITQILVTLLEVAIDYYCTLLIVAQWCLRIASRILHEIFLLIGELAIRRTSLYDELIFPNQ